MTELTVAIFDHYFVDKPDQQPGFWPDYAAANNPSPMAAAIQRPLTDPHWQQRVLNAYVARSPKKTPAALR